MECADYNVNMDSISRNRVTFLCNVLVKLIIHQKALYDIFYEKVVKWWDIKWNQKNSKKYIFILHEYDTIGCEH